MSASTHEKIPCPRDDEGLHLETSQRDSEAPETLTHRPALVSDGPSNKDLVSPTTNPVAYFTSDTASLPRQRSKILFQMQKEAASPSEVEEITPNTRSAPSSFPWLKRKRFIIPAAAVVLIIVAAVLAGVLSQRTKNPTTPPGSVLGNTKLVSTSWLDASNNTIKAVFFQAVDSSLLMAKWNATTRDQTWVIVNITQSAMAAGSPISPKIGTPLAVSVPEFVDSKKIDDFWLDLYFITAAGTLSGVWCWNVLQKGDAWKPDTLASYEKPYLDGFLTGTQIAACRDQCSTNCTQSSQLIYQNGNRKPMLATSFIETWQKWEMQDLSRQTLGSPAIQNIEPGSSLALTRVAPAGNGTDPAEMRVYVDVSHQLQEYVYFKGVWTKSNMEWQLPDSAAPPTVIAVSYKSASTGALSNILLTILLDNGTSILHWRNLDQSTEWQTGYPSPTNVICTALAVSPDIALPVKSELKAYCLTDGQVLEYNIDKMNPSSWSLASNINISATVNAQKN